MNKKIINIVWIFVLCFIFCKSHAIAFDLDMTVDDDIRKNYNSSKLIKDTGVEELETLPDLPEALKNSVKESAKETKSQKQSTAPLQVISSGNTKIKKGTSFNVVNCAQISDWQTKGATVKFKTKTQIVNRHYAIPASTVFTGEVIESHQPQISCNGGLVVIRVNSMTYNGRTYPISAYVTKANSKKIFLNNIKGKRTYLKTMWNKGNWGRALFGRMMTLTVNLGGEGSTLLLSPFPLAYGTICLGVNALTSPICAFFSKGGHVNIPAGSSFKLKLLSDAFVE